MPEGPSVSGPEDRTRGIGISDLAKAKSYLQENSQNMLELPRLYDLIRKGENNKVISTLNEWKQGSDQTKKLFAQEALQHAQKRREKNWHSDD